MEQVHKMNELFPGDRVLVFDSLLYKDDKSTPLSITMRPATIVARYGRKDYDWESRKNWVYSDLIDVEFDHRPGKISHGHFTNMCKKI